MSKCLGQGWEGCVVKNEDRTVSKFGFKESLLDEFVKMAALQRRIKTNLHIYSNFRNVRLIKLDDHSRIPNECTNLKRMIKSISEYEFSEENRKWSHENIKNFVNIKTFNAELYEIVMPFIPGKSINQIRSIVYHKHDTVKYEDLKINYTLYTEICEMPTSIRNHLVKLLTKLSLEVAVMNSEKIFHNDLHPGNLIVYGENIKVVDWGYVTFDEPLTEIFGKPIISDVTKIMEVIELITV